MSANRFFQVQSTTFRRALLGTTCLVGLALAATNAPAQDLPVYNSTIFGTVDVTNVTARQQNIEASNIAGANFDSFNICTVCTVNINSAGSNPLFVGIINSSSFEPTRIMGTLNSNARTVLRDRNGFIFGRDSVVNALSLVATTGELDLNHLQTNPLSFEINDLYDSTITLRGTINIEEGGFAAFVAPQVRNFGVINAKLGRVAMAAGEVITVDMYGDNLISLAADPATTKAIITQRGEINAEGGVVQLSADAASATVNNLINMSGVIRTASATTKGGKIILSGGRVNVEGTLDARGAETGEGPIGGGDIHITSRNDTYIRDTGYLVTNEGGSVNITAGDDIHLFGPETVVVLPRAMNTIDTFGGDVVFDATGQIVIEEDQIVNAGGGNITFTNDDGLVAARQTIVTEGEGNITYEQNKSKVSNPRYAVQVALDAVSNTGDGLTTLKVGAGNWDEFVTAGGKTISNLVFSGAKAGEDARGAGPFTDGETVLSGASFYSLDSLTVDGFYFGDANPEVGVVASGSPFTQGIIVYDTGDVTIVNNIIRDYSDAGINVVNSGTVEISQNNIDGQSNMKGTHGVQLVGVNDAVVSNNNIANNNNEELQAGILVNFESFRKRPEAMAEGPHIIDIDRPTPNIVISGNNLTDNSYGMVFTTGNIDVTGEANTIIGGLVGMLFTPAIVDVSVTEIGGDLIEPLVDFTTAELNLVGNTIGSTVFDGQTEHFVRLENGALFNPGTPTILSGLDATYVTPFGRVTPSANGGFVTGDQLTFLETMFQHFIDDNTLGLFLFGGLGSPDSFNIEDTYRNAFANYQANNPGPGFTILGLPNTGFNVGTRGFGGLPGNLNDIAPAAGGNSPSNLNNIAPAAGSGSEVSCWQDAVNNAAQGNSSTYNMSTDPNDALNAAASCGAS